MSRLIGSVWIKENVRAATLEEGVEIYLPVYVPILSSDWLNLYDWQIKSVPCSYNETSICRFL